MIYRFVFSDITGQSAIHSPTCPRAYVHTRGLHGADVEASSADDAARAMNAREELVARGFSFPVVCRCAKRSSIGE